VESRGTSSKHRELFALYQYAILFLTTSIVVNRIEKCSICREIHPIESEKQAAETRRWVKRRGGKLVAGLRRCDRAREDTLLHKEEWSKGEIGGCSRETVVEKEQKEEEEEEEDGVEESRRRREGERHSRRRRRRWFSWETKERERRKISSRREVAGLKAPFSSPRRVTRSWRLLPRRAATTASHRIYKSVWRRVRFLYFRIISKLNGDFLDSRVLSSLEKSTFEIN